jgi:hypothetical protein
MQVLRQFSILALLLAVQPLHAAETITYSYDAKGRLTKVVRTGSVNNNVQSQYTHDKANNRMSVTVTGSTSGGGGAPISNCTLLANDVEGSTEYSVYPNVTISGNCSFPIRLEATVQTLSGTGTYFNYGFEPYGSTFLAGDTSKSIRLKGNGVSEGQPLTLRVQWSVGEGDASFSKSTSNVIIFNGDCYC